VLGVGVGVGLGLGLGLGSGYLSIRLSIYLSTVSPSKKTTKMAKTENGLFSTFAAGLFLMFLGVCDKDQTRKINGQRLILILGQRQIEKQIHR
jgi:hypothetical protein